MGDMAWKEIACFLGCCLEDPDEDQGLGELVPGLLVAMLLLLSPPKSGGENPFMAPAEARLDVTFGLMEDGLGVKGSPLKPITGLAELPVPDEEPPPPPPRPMYDCGYAVDAGDGLGLNLALDEPRLLLPDALRALRLASLSDPKLDVRGVLPVLLLLPPLSAPLPPLLFNDERRRCFLQSVDLLLPPPSGLNWRLPLSPSEGIPSWALAPAPSLGLD
mmetsp:Transcript_15724/g.44063  ORF Transcript_15724/g.44063 Transcript_15724/m.44063 type:complete len:218 (+) Transcript_15724:1261-1914(+)